VDEPLLLAGFHEFVCECRNRYDDMIYKAPYLCLVASSMSGKSRLCRELVVQKEFGFFMCLRPSQGDTGYPPGSPALFDFFRSVQSFTEVTALLCVCMASLQEERNRKSDLTFEGFLALQGEDYWREIVAKARAHFTEAHIYDEARNPKAIDLCNKRKGPVLFVVDEAQYLLEPSSSASSTALLFEHFRHACRALGAIEGFVILNSTTSRIANFAPPAHMVKSSARSGPANQLFPAFCTVAFNDVLSLAGEAKTWRQKLAPGVLFSLGRAGFGAMCRSISAADEEDFYKTAVALARLKLKPNNLDSDSSFGVLAARFCLDVAPTSQLAQDLVAHSMATCLHINEDRSSVVIGYPSEPLLAEAGARVMWEDELMSVNGLLRNLCQGLQSGLIGAGARGELLGRILLTLARDKSISRYNCVFFCFSLSLVTCVIVDHVTCFVLCRNVWSFVFIPSSQKGLLDANCTWSPASATRDLA